MLVVLDMVLVVEREGCVERWVHGVLLLLLLLGVVEMVRVRVPLRQHLLRQHLLRLRLLLLLLML